MSPQPPHARPGETPETALQISAPNTSDIACEFEDYEDFAGGVNPLGYKGHGFHPNGYGCSHSPDAAPPSSFTFVSPRRPQLPDYDFGDGDEHILSVTPPPAPPQPPPPPPDPSPTALTCGAALIGPVWPFVDAACLAQVGASTVLPDGLYLAWRATFLVLSLATGIITLLQNPRLLAYFPGAAIMFSVLCHGLLVRRALLYRALRANQADTLEMIPAIGWDALVYQGTLHLCVASSPALGISSLFAPGDSTVIGGLDYFGSVTSYLLLVITVWHLIDIFIVPIPFRITFVVPVVIYSMIISIITMWAYARTFSSFGIMLIGTASAIIGILMHILARAISILHHQKQLAQRITLPLSNSTQPPKT